MNILIVNQPPFNRGDESAHKGLIRALLKKTDVKIRILTKHEWIESVRQYAVIDERVEYIYEPISYFKLQQLKDYGLRKGKKWLWIFHPMMRYYKKNYQWADIVLCAPGGICMGGFQDWDHLCMLHLSKFYNKPLAYFGRSFGPFPTETELNRRFKDLSIEMLNYFSFLSVRDSKSEQLAKEMGYSYVSTVDSAFLDSPKVEIPYEIWKSIGDKPYMVFVPNYLLWHYAYKGKISHNTILDFYSRMIDVIKDCSPGYNIVMLPQLFGRDHCYPVSDVQFFRDLAKMKLDNHIIVTSDNYSSDIQQSVIAGAKYVIGARYHSIVFAINQNIPFISLSYEHKMFGLLETLGKTEWCVDITNTFSNTSSQSTTLERVKALIPNLINDDMIRDKAKAIAMQGMDSFIESLSNLKK